MLVRTDGSLLCIYILLQVKLKVELRDVNTSCADLDLFFSLKERGERCNSVMLCTNEEVTRKLLFAPAVYFIHST